jgi:hypothetical protein
MRFSHMVLFIIRMIVITSSRFICCCIILINKLLFLIHKLFNGKIKLSFQFFNFFNMHTLNSDNFLLFQRYFHLQLIYHILIFLTYLCHFVLLLLSNISLNKLNLFFKFLYHYIRFFYLTDIFFI